MIKSLWVISAGKALISYIYEAFPRINYFLKVNIGNEKALRHFDEQTQGLNKFNVSPLNNVKV